MERRWMKPGVLSVSVLAVALSSAPEAMAQATDLPPGAIVIRQTLPQSSVKREPLTSDQLSTASTRLIDARRGFRPFDSVLNDGFGGGRPFIVGFDDHFGISRPEDRPFSFSQRTPRTFVKEFRNTNAKLKAPSSRGIQQSPKADAGVYVLIPPTLAQVSEDADTVKQDLQVRIHSDRGARPKTSGAVMVLSDGRVIQIGD